MSTPTEQFYSLVREAMFANQLTASDLSSRMEVHYTYIYNTVRNNANVTLQSATNLAEAAGYHMRISFEPIPGRNAAELTGTMEPTGKIYSRRRSKAEVDAAQKKVTVQAEDPKTVDANDVHVNPDANDLDAEIEALLGDV